jgi:hypothetical protein
MRDIYIFLLMALISSCGKAPSMPEPEMHQSAPTPLIGKSSSEIMDLKYNNQIYLNCSIRVNSQLMDTFSWPISSESSMMKFLNYKSGQRETIIAVRLKGKLEFLDRLSHVSETNKEYDMDYTPVIKISFKRAAKEALSNGSIHEKYTFTDRKLFENIEGTLFSIVSEDIHEELRCSLKTIIKPQYKHHWKVIR